MSRVDALRLQSCTGEVSGQWLLQPVVRDLELGDMVWPLAFKLRVVIDTCKGKHCARVTNDGHSCSKPLDDKGHHCLTCDVGPLVKGRHKALEEFIADMGTQAGYAPLSEQVIPA